MLEEQFDFPLHVQHSLLSLGIFDNDIIRYLTKIVSPNNFITEEARITCELLQDFYRRYKCAPADHFADLVETKAYSLPETLRDSLIEFMHRIWFYNANKHYVLNQLHRFLKYAQLAKAMVEGAKLLQRGELEKTQEILMNSFKTEIWENTFDSINLCVDVDKRPNLNEEIMMETRIEALDKAIAGFRRKNLIVWLASTNLGKTWALTHCAKEALSQGLNVLFYTLELEPEWVATRLDMGLTGMGITAKMITLQPSGVTRNIEPMHLNQEKRKKVLHRTLCKGGTLYILGSPYAGLTVSQIEMDLEVLTQKVFSPDVIIIDYADLMTPESEYKEWRHQLATMYKQLRQLAVTRNCLMLTASQSNRASIGARVVSLQHFAEDIQKANIADMVLSLCQTPEEEKLDRMRIFCCKNRYGKKGFQIVNYYNYDIGQFSLESSVLEDV